MDKYELQKLRDLPIEGVAGRLGLQVVRGHKCLCPFHPDKHPSLSLDVRRNMFHCFVCGASGGTIDLVMRHLGKDFREACRWLSDGSNVILTECHQDPQALSLKGAGAAGGTFDPSRYVRFFEHPWLNAAARHFLYEERCLDPRVVSWCRLTSWTDRNGIDWLQIPYYDMEGRLIGVQNRRLSVPTSNVPPKGDIGGVLPRFRFPSGSRCSIYNLPVLNLLRPGEGCWITEGCSDCWSLLSAGCKALAIASATLLQHKDKQLLQEVTARLSIRWMMAPDQDEPGRRLASQLQAILPMLQIVELPSGCKDVSEYYVKQKSCNNNEQ